MERIRVAVWCHRIRGDLLRQARTVSKTGHEAEDAVQEVMLKAVQKYQVLRDRPEVVVQAYLRAALLNHLRSVWRHQGRVQFTVITAEHDVPAPPPMEQPPFSDEDVKAEIERLPERTREALHLRLQGHSYKAIATQMGVKTGTVGALLAEARVRLRSNLLNLEEESNGGAESSRDETDEEDVQ
ncbi:MAG TPA: RNA polymerase sigma factor [Myxococcaceae bacterium]